MVSQCPDPAHDVAWIAWTGEVERSHALAHTPIEADARLIAAAPDLLAACKAAHDVLMPEGHCEYDQWACAECKLERQLRAAIQQAEAAS